MGKLYSLREMLEEYDVVIPKLQRDYAQGRKGKEHIRRRFLEEIKRSGSTEDQSLLTLDFVYGTVESAGEEGRSTCFYPLDGQQRLTTLWLVHWYVSLRAGRLAEDSKFLKKFTYSTRASSKEFLEKLCMSECMDGWDNQNVADFIKGRTWFFSAWLQDPTIVGMLRMLSGDELGQKDNIEAVFNDNRGWEQLRNSLSSVKFRLLRIGTEELPLSDDLYIKMNARGKRLTDFENFKADLVSWMNRCSSFSAEDSRNFALKIDTDWMDLFWQAAMEEIDKSTELVSEAVDALYFEFINRYVLNMICLQEEARASDFQELNDSASDERREIKSRFDKLYGTSIVYDGFDLYENYLSKEAIEILESMLTEAKSNLKLIDGECSVLKENHFLPEWEMGDNNQNGRVKDITQKGRVYFLAVTLFIAHCENLGEDKVAVNFKRWMRVCRNLIENGGVSGVDAMVTCMRLINELADMLVSHDGNAYEVFKTLELDCQDGSRLKHQLQEEKEKAIKILEDAEWEDKICDAEKFGFFNGTIRFLYKDASSEICWDDFDRKFNNASSYFNGEDGSVNSESIIKFLGYFCNFDEIENKYLFISTGDAERGKCWKGDILCNNGMVDKVHEFLMGSDFPDRNERFNRFLANNELLEKIIEESKKGSAENGGKYCYCKHRGECAIHKDKAWWFGVYLSDDWKEKCEKLHALAEQNKTKLIEPDFNVWIGGYYWGHRVEFEYRGHKYLWYRKWSEEKRDHLEIIECEGGGEDLTWEALDKELS